jgi:hypothetical protein
MTRRGGCGLAPPGRGLRGPTHSLPPIDRHHDSPQFPDAPATLSGAAIGSAWHGSGLENGRAAAHIGGMAQKSRTKLLEVAIVERSTSSWEWSVHFGAEVLICGVESTHAGARFAGNDALFQILASAPGWDE